MTLAQKVAGESAVARSMGGCAASVSGYSLFPHADGAVLRKAQGGRRIRGGVFVAMCVGTEQDGEGATRPLPTPATTATGSTKKVLSDLDAILGIEPEPEPVQEEPKATVSGAAAGYNSGVGRDGGAGAPPKSEEGSDGQEKRDEKGEITKKMKIIGEMLSGNSPGGEEGEAKLRQEFDGLLEILKQEKVFSKDDIKLAKEKVFGPTTFWVTGVQVAIGKQDDILPESASFRGNLRADKETVYKKCSALTQEVFGGKYMLFMTEDMEAEEDDPRTGGARVVFQMVPTTAIEMQPTQAWEYPVALVLLFLTVVSSVQLGLVAQIDKLPRDLLDSMSKLAELSDTDAIIPDDTVLQVQSQLEATGVMDNATPIVLGILAATAANELTQWAVAKYKGVKLGLPFVVPTPQLGTFGALRTIKSVVKDRTDLFDIAAAGPLAALAVSASLMAAGIMMSSGDVDAAVQNALIPVPEKIFQGSLFLGTIADMTIPHTGTGAKAVAMIHPLFIAGWCGLSAVAFQLLPLGSTDGGRIAQSAYGRGVLALSSLLTYGFLAFGIIGGTLSLQYGLLALLWARSPSRNILNDASEISKGRQLVRAIRHQTKGSR